MYIKIFLLSVGLFLNFKGHAASSTYDMEEPASCSVAQSIQDITFYPEGFIEWSESGGSSDLFSLSIHLNEGTELKELNAEFWNHLSRWSPQITGLGFINHNISVQPLVDLESVKVSTFPHLSKFLLIGVNPGRPFIHTFQELPFCESLKSLRMFNCGRLDSSPYSSEIIDLAQVKHLTNIPSLRGLEELDLDLISTPDGLAIIDASPYIKRSQCVINSLMPSYRRDM